MSWHLHDPNEGKVFDNFSHPSVSVCKRHAKAKAMMHPDDLQKIALIIVSGTAAAICIFTLRILAAGLGG